MSDHFRHFGVKILHDAEEARTRIAAARAGLRRAIRGSEAVELLRLASQRWSTEPAWRERARACIEDFGVSPTELLQLEGIPASLAAGHWQRKLEVELSFPRAIDKPYENTRTSALLSYEPLGLLLHICPGNSFFGGMTSLLHGFVAGNQNLLKLSRNTPAVVCVLIELLEACGMPPGQAVPVLWDAGNDAVEGAICPSVDGIVVWGGDAAIHHFRSKIGSGIRFIDHGPKLSFSVLTVEGARDDAGLRALLDDVCRYDQVSCASSQVLLVEVPPEAQAGTAALAEYRAGLLSRLRAHFDAYTREHPPAPKTVHEQVEVLKVWERAKLAKARGKGDYESGYPDWLVVWAGDDRPIEPSPLFRTWLLYPYHDDESLGRLLTPVRHYLQTASVACGASELMGLSQRLWSLGVNRIVDAGRSLTGMEGAPHDGSYLLTQFCRVTSLESPARSRHLWQSGDLAFQFAEVAKIVQWAQRAPFYARRFEEAGIEAGRLQDWDQFRRIPWLHKEDIHAFGPPRSSDLLTTPFEQVEGAYLFTTGGTTGDPRYVLYNRREWDEVTDIFCRQIEVAGVTRSDRVANLFIGGGLWAAFITVCEALEKLGCVNLPVGGEMDPGKLLPLLEQLGVTAIFGVPATILRLAHAIEAEPSLALRLPKILYGGEFMTDAMRAYVKQVFGAQIVKSASYSAVDGGTIGYQCPAAQGNVHHALEGHCYVEICDEATGSPVPLGESGELVLTNLSRRLFPVIRLRSGDRARALREPCPCGTSALTFELLGRNDDMIRAGGGNIFVSDVDRLCERFPEQLSMMYQLRLTKVGVDDSYELCIETKRPLAEAEVPMVTARLTTEYLAIAAKLKASIDGGFFRHFKLSLLPPGTLQGSAKTGKLRRVIDER